MATEQSPLLDGWNNDAAPEEADDLPSARVAGLPRLVASDVLIFKGGSGVGLLDWRTAGWLPLRFSPAGDSPHWP
jgi:hypothetical protein